MPLGGSSVFLVSSPLQEPDSRLPAMPPLDTLPPPSPDRPQLQQLAKQAEGSPRRGGTSPSLRPPRGASALTGGGGETSAAAAALQGRVQAMIAELRGSVSGQGVHPEASLVKGSMPLALPLVSDKTPQPLARAGTPPATRQPPSRHRPA
mmetsp:Transcript_49473/g.108025  ORF Transcript_49473/g.108025 Transcript_49473/m.108025 type:complete len:150 (+) Transcript_49473:2-451(+)